MTTYLSIMPPPGQSPAFSVVEGISGTSYKPDANGIYTVATPDADYLIRQGWIQPLTLNIIGMLLGANMNSTADQLIPLYVPATTLYRVNKVTVTNASVSLTTAVGGLYTGAGKTGSALVANSQVYSALTTGLKAVDLTLALNQRDVAGTLLYLSLTTAQGAAATADVYVYGDRLAQ
jgi:hypothetical protein